MSSARPTVVQPTPPAGPGAAPRQNWSARPKRGGEPRPALRSAATEAAPTLHAEGQQGARRGLSVAEAARASPIAFRPLGRSPQAAPAAAPEPADPLARVTPGRAEPRARFAKTVAELERHLTAVSRWEEPGARIVPRPALARPDHGAAAGPSWSRLWPQRKGPAAE